MKHPMKSRDVLPKMFQWWGGVGCVMQGWGVSYRGGVGHAGVGWDLVKHPMKSRDVLPKNVPGVGWGEGGHKSTEYNKNFAYVMLYWINFTDNHCIVDFLTLIFLQMT